MLRGADGRECEARDFSCAFLPYFNIGGGSGSKFPGQILLAVSFYRLVWLIVTRSVRHLSCLLVDCDFQGDSTALEGAAAISAAVYLWSSSSGPCLSVVILAARLFSREVYQLPAMAAPAPENGGPSDARRMRRGRAFFLLRRMRVASCRCRGKNPRPVAKTICVDVRDALGFLRYLEARTRARWPNLIF